MKNSFLILLLFVFTTAKAQELYVSTEPASNMATGSIGLRLNSKLFKMNDNEKFDGYRIEPEIMFGVTKHLMIHLAAYGSNMFQSNFKMEGVSLYGKYRFYSNDDVHEHFRLAAFSKISIINNPETAGMLQSNEIDPDGNNSSIVSGIVATKLKNKTAVSAAVAYGYRFNNIDHPKLSFQPSNAINYSASIGYLLFPKEYTNYKQTNMNVYMEVLGQTFVDKPQSYVDVAPAIQFIFNSIARVDISYRTQLAGNISRLSSNYFMMRFEYNLLNVFGKK